MSLLLENLEDTSGSLGSGPKNTSILCAGPFSEGPTSFSAWQKTVLKFRAGGFCKNVVKMAENCRKWPKNG